MPKKSIWHLTEKESCYRGGSFCILTKMHQINFYKKKIKSHLPLLYETLHAQFNNFCQRLCERCFINLCDNRQHNFHSVLVAQW